MIAVAEELDSAPGDGERLSMISGDWPLISATIGDTLRDQPDMRDRVLLALANAYA